MRQAGLTQVGINGIFQACKLGFPAVGLCVWRSDTPLSIKGVLAYGYKAMHLVTSKLFGAGYWRLTAKGGLLTSWDKLLSATGYRYELGHKIYFLMRGGLGSLRSDYFYSQAFLRQRKNESYKANSILAGYFRFRFNQTGFLLPQMREVIKATGFAFLAFAARHRVIGATRKSFLKSYGIRSALQSKLNNGWLSSGKLMDGLIFRPIVKGIVSVPVTSLTKMCGNVDSKNIASYIVIVGTMSVISYIARVPIRIQEFITNKRWFK